jgi:precorrin-6B methylase 2
MHLKVVSNYPHKIIITLNNKPDIIFAGGSSTIDNLVDKVKLSS